MSKWSKVECNIQDREDLEKALKDVCYRHDIEFQTGEDLVLRGYNTQRSGAHFRLRRHDITARVSHTYGDMGYVWNEERRAYDLHLDDDYGRLTEFVGKINQRYTYHHTIKVMAAQGFEAVEQQEANGEIRLEFRKTRRVLAKAKTTKKKARRRLLVGR